jgi:hypothetical protein
MVVGLIFNLKIMKRSKKIEIMNLESYDIVNEIAYKTIDTAIRLYGKRDNIDEFIQFVIKEIKNRIDNSDLQQFEKDYWIYEYIENHFTSIIVKTYRKSVKD